MMHLVVSFCIYATVLSAIIVQGVILTTKQGIIKGATSRSRDGRIFYTFHGIPYAEPPVGQLRFENPVAAKPWNGVRDGTHLPPLCLQYFMGQISGQEDCLYLNVYTPKITNSTLLPVMVFIYGGRFMFGDALPDSYGAHYFMDRNVVLITFHYRLGIFGYLSTEDEAIPGNYGLKDAVAVLQWVQKYIDDFGGDKNRVTVFGGSSGGVSASLTLISPLAKGLLHRVISQSGQSFEIEKPGTARLNAWKIASLVPGCNGDNVKTSEALRDCLKNIPAKELVANNWSLFVLGDILPNLPWSPVIENEKVPGAFLVDEPSKLLQRKSDIPWIIGQNSADGALMALTIHVRSYSPVVMAELDANYKKYFPSIFRYVDDFANGTTGLDSVTEVLKCHYFGQQNISADVEGFSKMFTSLVYSRFLKKAVKLYRGPKYVYYYDHLNEESFIKVYEIDTDFEAGVIHGEELVSMFNWSSTLTPVTKGVDLVVSEKMLDLWTNFAANGDPNYEDEILWEQAESSDDINYLHIRNGIFKMKNQFLKDELNFLESLPAVNGCD